MFRVETEEKKNGQGQRERKRERERPKLWNTKRPFDDGFPCVNVDEIKQKLKKKNVISKHVICHCVRLCAVLYFLIHSFSLFALCHIALGVCQCDVM